MESNQNAGKIIIEYEWIKEKIWMIKYLKEYYLILWLFL